MLKHHLTALALSLVLASGTAYAAPDQDNSMLEAVPTEQLADGQENVEGDWANSIEVNTVEESAEAREMIQDERAMQSDRLTQQQKVERAMENDKAGGAITIIAMCVVICALAILSILFYFFGKISASLMARNKQDATGIDPDTAEDHHDAVDSGEVIAAIGAALSEHFVQVHDLEDTILTIRRMKRAYSPWNSKIYNLRQVPDLKRNVR